MGDALEDKLRYRSNLTAPDLAPYFKLKQPPLQALGHDMPSDPDFLPGCGFWTHDEAAILWTVANQFDGRWLDIGSRLGWTSAHLVAAGVDQVLGIDPEYAEDLQFFSRAVKQCPEMIPVALSSEEFFEVTRITQRRFDAAVIDGCHDSPVPCMDGAGAADIGARVILFHDFQGKPVRDAVFERLSLGWKARIYDTPNGIGLAWKDESFVPPFHVPDPAIDWAEIRSRYTDFDFSRCV